MKRGDLVRIVKHDGYPTPFNDGKIGIITSSILDHGEKKNDWAVVLVDGQFQLHAKRNLEVVNEEG